jgi:ABC-type transporter Mla MlaB component
VTELDSGLLALRHRLAARCPRGQARAHLHQLPEALPNPVALYGVENLLLLRENLNQA